MEFTKLNNYNREIICPLLHLNGYRTSDYSCGALLMFADYFNNEFCLEEDELYMRSSSEGLYYYSVPIGKKDLGEALDKLYDYAIKTHGYLKLLTVPEPCLEILDKKFKKVERELQRDWCDYLYLASDITELSGKRFHGKRNHVSRFRRENGDCFQPVTCQNRPQVVEFLDNFEKVGDNNELAQYENAKTSQLLLDVDCEDMLGGILEKDGKIIAATIGERIGDTLYVHVEKADRNFSGAYETIAHEFAKYAVNGDIAYINREEDVGDEGLRRAKMSWNPFMLLNKYKVEVSCKKE